MSCPVVAILGPTASGKSDLAQHVALRIDGEVVSADSMQVYRGMDIGTAKIPQANMLVPHHLIDILDPGEAFSAQLFQSLSRSCFPIFKTGAGFQFSAVELVCMCSPH